MTAKVPLKVHLRLRFQNLGKPRTAGLCGRAAGACDCGPLSCAKIERPSPSNKSGLKSSVFRPKPFPQLSPKSYRHNAVPNRFSSRFSTSRTNGPRLPSLPKAGTHSALGERSHTAAHTPKHGRFGWGWYHYPRSVSHGSETLRGRVSERQTLPLLGLGRVYARRTQKACGTAMRLCASLFRGVAAPLGCAALTVEFLAFLLLLKTTIANSLTPWYYGVTKSEAIG